MLALSLSGGGAKGAAHVGALLELEELGIKFDMIVGTSIGALVGAGYSLLGEAKPLHDYALRLGKSVLLKKMPGSKNVPSFLTCIGANLLPSTFPSYVYFYILKKIFKGVKFEDLKMNFFCTAVNLESGELEIFNEGLLYPALKASMAMPGAFKPVKINGKRYIDGGALENTPVLTPRNLGADKVIVLKLLSKKIKFKEVKNSASAFERIDDIREKISEDLTKSGENLIIELPTENFHTLDFTQTKDLIETGRKAISDEKDLILETIS